MSDNHRVYRTIKQAIMQLYPGEPAPGHWCACLLMYDKM